MKTIVSLLALPLLVGVAVASDGTVVSWTDNKDGYADYREGSFPVDDADCAYERMADPDRMVETLVHLEGVTVNELRQPGWQDVTLHERFFLVGLVESRYHRQIDGDNTLTWSLVSGRQKRHEGTWRVESKPDGSGVVHFDNLIEAKGALQQPVVRKIQNKTMDAIVSDIQRSCSR